MRITLGASNTESDEISYRSTHQIPLIWKVRIGGITHLLPSGFRLGDLCQPFGLKTPFEATETRLLHSSINLNDENDSRNNGKSIRSF